jgi:hypothetical protein
MNPIHMAADIIEDRDAGGLRLDPVRSGPDRLEKSHRSVVYVHQHMGAVVMIE